MGHTGYIELYRGEVCTIRQKHRPCKKAQRGGEGRGGKVWGRGGVLVWPFYKPNCHLHTIYKPIYKLHFKGKEESALSREMKQH